MPHLHSLRSWAMYFTVARLRLAGKMIISPRLRLEQIIFIGALINCLSLNKPLITTISSLALDPANFFFDHSMTLENQRVSKSDATLVDVIHTNRGTLAEGALGLTDALGHADFYPNGGKYQPGCQSSVFPLTNGML